MKKMIKDAAVLLLFTLLNAQFSTLFAQGTAFTYQGRLQNNGSPASGTYNLTFSIYTNGIGGTTVAGPVTNNAVYITNGLFTVEVDFGASVWSGATNWLQIGVASNGVAGFSILAPRQELTPAPYAITAGNLSGVLPPGHLPNFQGPDYATIGGGSNNTAAALGATVGGGFGNSASGPDATVPGGEGNSAAGQASFAAGQNATASDNHSFVWGDGTSPAFSQGADTFAVLATGGVYLYTTASGVGATLDYNGDLDFGVTTRQMINLYSDTYGIGVQSNDEYFRTADEFFWYVGGLHNDANGNAGGGLQAMELDNSGNLFVSGAVTAKGLVMSTNGVYGSTAANGSGGVSGVNHGTGPGVLGTGNSGDGIDGFSASGYGLFGISTNGSAAIRGFAINGNGIEGVSSNADGIDGGTVNGAYGVSGVNDGEGDGVSGVAVVGDGVYAQSEGAGAGVHGVNLSSGPAGKFDGNVSISGTVSFGTEIAQMLNLYSTTYAIGVQNSDEFFRTAGQYYWYLNGSYNNANGNSGGGSTMMSLTTSGLTVNGTFVSASDRNLKEHFQAVDGRQVLAQVSALPITRWNYKEDTSSQHIGPMAQDFYAAFGVGPDDKHITTIDEGGIALAAIQGLNERVNEKDARIQEQAAEIAGLKQSVEDLKKVVQSLAGKK